MILVHHTQHIHNEDVVVLVLLGVKTLTRVDSFQQFLLDCFLLSYLCQLPNEVLLPVIAVY